MQALERALHESTALLKVKAEECRQHESQAVEITEEAGQSNSGRITVA